MKCKRCKEEFDAHWAEVNAEKDGVNYMSCPFCNKLHKFYRTVLYEAVDDDKIKPRTGDSWGNGIISDKDYYTSIIDKKSFISFLKENNCYNQYMYNFRHHSMNRDYNDFSRFYKETIESHTLIDLIDNAFWWDETKEDFFYWENISNKFKEKFLK